MVKAKVIQFRRSRSNQKPRHFLIEIEGCDSREKASKFIGKSVEWASPSKKILKGKIAAAHGNKGIVRAIFEEGEGLPGQAIGTHVEIGGKE
jgi:large subunit ribosomal protein L35Ae